MANNINPSPTIEDIEAEIERRRRQTSSTALNNRGRISTADIEAEIERRRRQRVAEAYPSYTRRQERGPRNLEDTIAGHRVSREPSAGYRRAYQRQSDIDSVRSGNFQYRTPLRGIVGQIDQAAGDLGGVLARTGDSFDNWVSQFGRNLGVLDEMMGAGAFLTQGAENAMRRVNRQPIRVTAGEAGAAAMDFERDQQARYAREHPMLDVAATGAGILASAQPDVAASGVFTAAPRMSAFRAGATTAATAAPFAVARQEGTLLERAPGAAVETGVAGVFGVGGQALGNALASRAVPRAAANADAFQRAGVRPTLAAVNGRGAGALTKAIGENPFGGNVRNALQASIDDTHAAAERIGGQYATAAPNDVTGQNVIEGVRRWARGTGEGLDDAAARTGNTSQSGNNSAWNIPTRQWSFGDKANALYDDVFGRIDAVEQAMTGFRGQQRISHTRGARGPRTRNPVTVSETRTVLNDIIGNVNSNRIASIVNDPQLVQVHRALRGENSDVRFRDLRALRTHVRELQRRPMLRQGVDDAGLARLEAALTSDIIQSAETIGGVRLANELRRVDQFYRAGMQRINRALEPFGRDGTTGARAFANIVTMASDRSGQNIPALRQLREALRPDEWRGVAATLIDHIGRAGRGAPEEAAGFSVGNFIRNWDGLDPRARQILFGSDGNQNLAAELDNLAHVARLQEGVEQFTNRSRSGSSAQNVSTIGAGGGAVVAMATGNPAPMAAFIGAIAGLRVTGEVLTNPAFVRWLVSAPRAGGTPGGVSHHMQMLATMAGRDPALAPIYTDLSHALGLPAPSRQHRPQQTREAAP
jgi:hypothetical protein